jgi:uncharacterized BrkB/YihY/UPF0761 family membrane protein
MPAFLLAIIPLLPTIMTILGYVLKWMGANQEVLENYKKLVISTQNSGLISVNIKDRLIRQKQEILDEVKEDGKVKEP